MSLYSAVRNPQTPVGTESGDRLANAKHYKVMTQEQVDQIVKAILEGKYSWACVLILRFAGFNPSHYIPYRTYKRLLKENGRHDRQKLRETIVESLEYSSKVLN
ncbi:HetP family heterocyst commitment protein [Geitlerinema calcuttense]|uniref:HetP family heterocyst commitment protein n=1 Tax=Geitlerinema calcuttense NRMC-F 0142 TaxID=2922238 RepID=A0ABT7LYJ4_9CYAN|nr:HetP family heterocyst commitment protein [Geitlerinema calcuttense]MDL5057068.1 HetP family heterocyst commitment protein [Geitlerinema calcuttense NRMC-F 0142]